MKVLYISDLDGTLLDNSGKLTAHTISILKDLISKGLLFTVATARTNATVLKMFSGIELNMPFILMNGVLIYDPVTKKNISSCRIDKNVADRIIEIYSEHNMSPMLYFLRDSYLEIVYDRIYNSYQQEYVSARNNLKEKLFTKTDAGTLSVRDTDELIYMVSLDKPENLSPIYEKIISLDVVNCAFYSDNYTNCNFMECMNKNVSKGAAAAKIKELLGIDKIISFGDNLNDIPLFEIADECYAVSNACDELKNIATGVIGSNDNDGVADFISEHFNNYLSRSIL